MGAAPGRNALLRMFNQCVCGQGDDRGRLDPVFGFPLPYLGGGRVSIHNRHLNIHDHQIILIGLEFFNGYFAMLGRIDRIRCLFQKCPDNQSAFLIVLHQQDTQGSQLFDGSGLFQLPIHPGRRCFLFQSGNNHLFKIGPFDRFQQIMGNPKGFAFLLAGFEVI